MDNLGVREVLSEREKERERKILIDFDRHFVGEEGRSRWKEEGRRNSVDVVVGEPVAKR